ncbi:GhoT/OrtT family toxin, partial [Enterobacter sp. PGRG2]|uniref:GhoT/OrtT family toxin n=1 Tax=Enterobacter sp. PGRG2 TaxID=3104013 RepID=UPI002ABE9534
MTLYLKLLIFYGVMAIVCGVITWFLTRDKGWVRLLAAVLVGLTWPMSFPMALLV